MKKFFSISFLFSIFMIFFCITTVTHAQTYDVFTYAYTTASTSDGNSVFGIVITDCDTSVSGSLKIPDMINDRNVVSISYEAFYGCNNLTDITLGASLVHIGNFAFSYCQNLENIHIDENNSYFSSENGILFNKEKTTLIQYPLGKTEHKYTVPDSITNIGCNAFSYHQNIKEITLSNNTAVVDSSSFNRCTALTAINVPDINQNFCDENGVLFDKNKTTLIQFPIGKSDAEYKIPDSVTKINSNAFWDCSALTNVITSENLTSIGNNAFRECCNLKEIIIPKDVESIGDYSFYNCTKLEKIFWNAKCVSDFEYNNDIFYNAGHDGNGIDVIYGDGVETLPLYMFNPEHSDFSVSPKIISVTIPETLTKINGSAFYGCTSIQRVNIENLSAWCNITFVHADSNPLYYAKKLYLNGKLITDLVIPEDVTTIKRFAFIGFPGKSLTLNENLESIKREAFYHCTNLEKIYWNSKNINNISNSSNIVFSSGIGANNEGISIIFGKNVEKIPDYAFYKCSKIKSIKIGKNIKSIGNDSFYENTGLKDVYYEGTESEYENIIKGYNNKPLLNATVHYNVPMIYANVLKNNDSYTLNTNFANIDNGEVIIAGYKNNKLVTVISEEFENSEKAFSVSGDIDTLSIMLWNDLESLKSICEATVIHTP